MSLPGNLRSKVGQVGASQAWVECLRHVAAEKQAGFRHLLHVSGLSRSAHPGFGLLGWVVRWASAEGGSFSSKGMGAWVGGGRESSASSMVVQNQSCLC